MKKILRKLTSIMLAMVLAASSFLVAQADGGATQITVTGRVAAVDSHAGADPWSVPEQIGFATSEVFPSGAWVSCGYATSGSILKNGTAQAGWTLQTLGTSGFVVACWGYTPAKDDVIKIPAGMQFSDGTGVYEISKDYNVKYDGSTWQAFVPVDATVTITGRVAGVDNHVQSGNEWSSPEQIGFTTNEAFPSGAWVSCGYATSGSILKNGTAQAGWTLQTLGTSGFVVACWGYVPTKNDVIKIPAGMQFTDGTKVYEIAADYYAKYDGSAWQTFKPADATITITGRVAGVDNHVQSGNEWSSPEQIGFTTNEVFTDLNWITCAITGGNVLVNDAPKSGWTLQTLGTSGVVLACWGYVPAKDDVIKIPAGTQFAYGTVVYEFATDYSVKYDGSTWYAYVPADAVVNITGRLAATDAASPVQIGFTIDGAFATGDWISCGITGDLVLNESNRGDWTIQTTGTNSFNLVCWNYVSTKGDIITIPAGTRFTYGDGKVYEFATDYSVKYDGATWSVYTPADVTITVTGRVAALDNHVAAGAEWSSPEQIGFATNEVFTDPNWITCGITGGSILVNDVARSGWTLQTTGTSGFVMACWGYVPAKDDVITIPAGTQFAYGAAVYEFATDYNVKYDGSTWYAYVPADSMINITGRLAATDGASPVQIGFTIDGAFATGDWVSCGIAGDIVLNEGNRGDWTIQTTGTNSFNLVCWNYEATKKDVITIPAGTRFTYNDGKIYEFATDYSVKYDGSTWVLNVEEESNLYDVSAYRSGETFTAPTKAGYVFAGWYEDEACTVPMDADVTEGDYYAKFIDADVLSVKAQVTKGTTASSEETNMRFISTVDGLDYQTVGFKIKVGDRAEKTTTSTVVYKQLYANVEGEIDTILPTDFCEESEWFFTYGYWEIPNEAFDVEFLVTPYFVTVDGTTVWGETVVKMVSQSYN